MDAMSERNCVGFVHERAQMYDRSVSDASKNTQRIGFLLFYMKGF